MKEAAALATLYHHHIVSISTGNTADDVLSGDGVRGRASLRERMRAPNQTPSSRCR
jgi:hypothetical protein